MMLAKANSQQGSAFILALMVVAAVGLLVVPVIYLATTGLRSTNLAQQRFLERYAADAGVEEGLWIIENAPLSVYSPVPGVTLPYQSTFNNLLTDIKITQLALPPDMVPPPTTEPVVGSAMSIEKIVIPHVTYPCMLGEFSCPSDVRFTYIMYIENYGSSKLHLERIGDCLPSRFKFNNDLQVTRMEGIIDNSSGDPLTVDDMNDDPADPDDLYFQVGPIVGDTDPLCPDGREQVKWVFEPPLPYIASETRAEIEFEATAQILGPDEHFNEAWVHVSPSSTDVVFSGETSPVFVEFAKYNISSSAGGSTVNARATVYEYSGGNTESYILSWQVE